MTELQLWLSRDTIDVDSMQRGNASDGDAPLYLCTCKVHGVRAANVKSAGSNPSERRRRCFPILMHLAYLRAAVCLFEAVSTSAPNSMSSVSSPAETPIGRPSGRLPLARLFAAKNRNCG